MKQTKDVRVEVYVGGRFIGSEVVQTDKSIDELIEVKKKDGFALMVKRLLKNKDNN